MGNEIDQMEASISDIKGATKIPITAAGNITASGSYILANDISGRIQILASNVSLDLNGHTITATSQDALLILGSSNIRICNGTIVQSGTGLNCIKIDDTSSADASRIVISNISCFLSNPANNAQAILLQANNTYSITDVLIKDCMLHGSGNGTGINLYGQSGILSRVKIEKCVVGYFATGMWLRVCSDCIVQNCFLYKTTIGIQVGGAPNARNALLHNRLRLCGTYGIVGDPTGKTLIYGNDIQGCTTTTTSNRPYSYASANYVYGNFAKNNAGMTTAADNYSPQIKLNMAGTITDVTGKWANIALP